MNQNNINPAPDVASRIVCVCIGACACVCVRARACVSLRAFVGVCAY